ncbi:MAG: 16S rRNA (cytosine(1402)-N(4))-methyltransferase [Acidobacteriota bacterium]
MCTCSRKQRVEILTRKPIRPTETEVLKNRRARSAKLRAIEKKGEQESDRNNPTFELEALDPETGWNTSAQVPLDPKQRFEATRMELESWIHSRLTRYELRSRMENKGVTPWSTFFSNN